MIDVHVLAATQAWWQGLLALLWALFIDVAVPVLVTLILALLAKHLHFNMSAKQRRTLDEYVDKAVSYADQKLRKALKEGEPPKDANAQRMQWAKEFLEKALIDTGLTKKAADKLEDLIEAKLGVVNGYKRTLHPLEKIAKEKKPDDDESE